MVMDIRLARIDDRLIHGQVATVWAKLTNINRILVVSDSVAHDNLRKALLVQAAPPGVKVNVITVQKMIDVYPDPRFDSFRSMLLFTNPLDVKRGRRRCTTNFCEYWRNEFQYRQANDYECSRSGCQRFKSISVFK